MKINYCLPIQEQSRKKLLKTLDAASKQYQYLEVWLDYVADIDAAFVKKLSKIYEDRIIFLFRRQNLEPPQIKQSIREEIIVSLNKSKSLLDLDIINQARELAYIKKHNLKIRMICSYHNYDKTPPDKVLKQILAKMSRNSPDIYKFAAYCKNQADSLRLMNLLIQLKSSGKKFIVLGMGANAMITRLFGTKWGNEMLFAPANLSKRTAPGQFTRKKYEKIFKLLNPS